MKVRSLEIPEDWRQERGEKLEYNVGDTKRHENENEITPRVRVRVRVRNDDDMTQSESSI